MAYRRRQGMARSSTFKEEIYHAPPSPEESKTTASYSSSSSLAAQAIRASAAHRDSSHPAFREYNAKGSCAYDSAPMAMDSVNGEGSFWGVLARKAKAILEEENLPQPQPETIQSKKMDNPTLRKGIDALTVSMNRIGDTIGNALEEGRTIVENRTADFIHETRKLQMKKREEQNGITGQTSQEDMLKASRDVAMATAAKAKLLLRELKTVKADLAFAKQRCSQLEDENKILRDASEKGVNPEDDDMIRLQLETLLAEKARLANENSVYARENRFLREIVEYHQLTMQDVVYLDEGIEEVTEVYPMPAVSRTLSASLTSPPSRSHSCASLAEEMIHAEGVAVTKEKSSSSNGEATRLDSDSFSF